MLRIERESQLRSVRSETEPNAGAPRPDGQDESIGNRSVAVLALSYSMQGTSQSRVAEAIFQLAQLLYCRSTAASVRCAKRCLV